MVVNTFPPHLFLLTFASSSKRLFFDRSVSFDVAKRSLNWKDGGNSYIISIYLMTSISFVPRLKEHESVSWVWERPVLGAFLFQHQDARQLGV